MRETMRVSVRELVAFSYFPADIMPMADMSAMQAGSRAHRARQAGARGECEKAVQHSFAMPQADVLVYGRMDVFEDGEVPFVEEIKLSGETRETPLPEHWAQAVCYAAMTALENARRSVRLCVCYVDAAGEALSRHEETLCADELAAQAQALIAPWLAFALGERAHQRLRDESLSRLAFPFDAYRKGQRELAVQVYTAIRRRKRLFATLPTGTGKSAAVLYPALKAMGEGLCGKALYLRRATPPAKVPLVRWNACTRAACMPDAPCFPLRKSCARRPRAVTRISAPAQRGIICGRAALSRSCWKGLAACGRMSASCAPQRRIRYAPSSWRWR